MRISKSQYYIIFLLASIIIVSLPIGNTGQQIRDFGILKYIMLPLLPDKFGNELSILEISQVIVIFYSIFINIKFRKKFIQYSNILSFLLRTGLLIILFYEEISFITMGMFDFTSAFNLSNQLNIHNSSLATYLIFNNFQIPLTTYSFNLNLQVLILVISSFFLGYGSYLKIFKNIKFLFLEKKYSIFFLFFPLNLILRSILFKLNILDAPNIFEVELIEFYMYFVLMIDTLFKEYKVKKIL